MTPPAPSPAAPVDTSAEAVAELVRDLRAHAAARIYTGAYYTHIAVTLAAVVKERDAARATVAQFEKLMAEIAEAVGKTTWFGDLAQLVKATLFEARESGRLAGRAEAAEIARAVSAGIDPTREHAHHEAVAEKIAAAILSASTTPTMEDVVKSAAQAYHAAMDAPTTPDPHRDPGGAHGG